MKNSTTNTTPTPVHELTANDMRNEYLRAWRHANPEKVREQNKRYWQRKATVYQTMRLHYQGYLPDEIAAMLKIDEKQVSDIVKSERGK